MSLSESLPMTVAARHRYGAEQRVDNRLLDAVRRGLEERIEARVGNECGHVDEVVEMRDRVGRRKRE